MQRLTAGMQWTYGQSSCTQDMPLIQVSIIAFTFGQQVSPGTDCINIFCMLLMQLLTLR